MIIDNKNTTQTRIDIESVIHSREGEKYTHTLRLWNAKYNNHLPKERQIKKEIKRGTWLRYVKHGQEQEAPLGPQHLTHVTTTTPESTQPPRHKQQLWHTHTHLVVTGGYVININIYTHRYIDIYVHKHTYIYLRKERADTCCRYLLLRQSAISRGHRACQSSHYCPDRLASGARRGPKRHTT